MSLKSEKMNQFKYFISKSWSGEERFEKTILWFGLLGNLTFAILTILSAYYVKVISENNFIAFLSFVFLILGSLYAPISLKIVARCRKNTSLSKYLVFALMAIYTVYVFCALLPLLLLSFSDVRVWLLTSPLIIIFFCFNNPKLNNKND
jgi:hypothetical protein